MKGTRSLHFGVILDTVSGPTRVRPDKVEAPC